MPDPNSVNEMETVVSESARSSYRVMTTVSPTDPVGAAK